MRHLPLFLLCLLLLCSCCATVTTGEGLDAVGRQQPMIPQVSREKSESLFCISSHSEPLTVWKKGSMYFAELPVVYVPVNSPWFSLNAPLTHRRWPAARTAAERYEQQSEVQLYYVELSEEQLGLARRSVGKHLPLYQSSFRVLPAHAVDLSGARKESRPGLGEKRYLFLNQLPDKRTVGNHLRRPLVWGLQVVDVPLTIGASAIGLLVNLLCAPFED
ncbi:MAG: hypothetical protein IJ943_04985 [Akkermansia sp.]|nr:hypothetical protein [Akkermansia sp.]